MHTVRKRARGCVAYACVNSKRKQACHAVKMKLVDGSEQHFLAWRDLLSAVQLQRRPRAGLTRTAAVKNINLVSVCFSSGQEDEEYCTTDGPKHRRSDASHLAVASPLRGHASGPESHTSLTLTCQQGGVFSSLRLSMEASFCNPSEGRSRVPDFCLAAASSR